MFIHYNQGKDRLITKSRPSAGIDILSLRSKFRCAFLVLILIAFGCSNKQEPEPGEILATVNGESITKKQFIRRLELTPLPGFHKPTNRNLRGLNLMINEVVVSQWAEENGYAEDPDFQKVMDFIKDQALIRELFLEEIRKNAEPDSQEITQALKKSAQQLTIRVLFTKNEKIAAEWQKALQKEKKFQEIVEESKNDYGVQYSSSTFRWGDGSIPIKVEEAAYRLNMGENSNVIELPGGFAIIYLENKVRDVSFTPLEFQQKWNTVKKVLRARKETILANEYIEKLLAPLKIVQKAEGFHSVVNFIEKQVQKNPGDSIKALQTFEKELEFLDEQNLKKIVISAPDLEWNGIDVLNILKKYNYPISLKNTGAISKTLSNFLKSAVRDHYLAKQAKKKGLERRTGVREDVQTWRRYFLYLKGVSAFALSGASDNKEKIITRRIKELRDKSDININNELLENISLTGIPMLALWSGDINKQLVVPPFVVFPDSAY
jgi:hypothetical protein